MASAEDQGLPSLLMVAQRQGRRAKLDCQADRLLAVRCSNSGGPYYALRNLRASITIYLGRQHSDVAKACLGCRYRSLVSTEQGTDTNGCTTWGCQLCWQDNMVLMSRFVRHAMRMVRAASSGDELDV